MVFAHVLCSQPSNSGIQVQQTVSVTGSLNQWHMKPRAGLNATFRKFLNLIIFHHCQIDGDPNLTSTHHAFCQWHHDSSLIRRGWHQNSTAEFRTMKKLLTTLQRFPHNFRHYSITMKEKGFDESAINMCKTTFIPRDITRYNL